MATHYVQDISYLFLYVPLSATRGEIIFSRTRLRFGNRAFCVAGPTAWNSLTFELHQHLSTYKNRPKTHLFLQSYFAA